jgi:hypothetical protein
MRVLIPLFYMCVCLLKTSNGQSISSRANIETIPLNFIDAFGILNRNLKYAEAFQDDSNFALNLNDFIDSIKDVIVMIQKNYKPPENISKNCAESVEYFFSEMTKNKDWPKRG